MPSKDFILDDSLPVTVYKRKGNRHLRLSIASTGKVRVSIPAWAPYSAGLTFARSRQTWIAEQHKPLKHLAHGQAIGKAHHLEFTAKPGLTRPASRVSAGSVLVSYPSDLTPSSAEVQRVATEASVRALRAQAERLLPQRLAALAEANSFSYRGVSIKRLRGRWGSCDQNANIVLNLFLMQLPWDLIDYVLLHELTHTKVLRHGPDFWRTMATVLPATPERRKGLCAFQPVLNSIG